MKVYDALLRFYPASFRNEYGVEMRAVFERRRREAAGPLATAALWVGAVREVLGNAALVHLDVLQQDLAYAGRVVRRAPGFAITAILMVALGIGATTGA